MQQTQTYKLNKPDADDPITPVPLNENADTLDAALSDHEQRVIALEGCRIVMGRYETGQKTIELGERPVAVMCMSKGTDHPYAGFVIGDSTATSQSSIDLVITDTGFKLGGKLSGSSTSYCFIAFLGGWATKDFLKSTT